MPPFVFASEQDLIKDLKSKNIEIIANKFLNNSNTTVADVVRNGIAGNTYRAFAKLPKRPSVVFRAWATAFITKSLAELNDISNDGDYSVFIHDATEKLCIHWKTEMSAELGYGRGSKLLNLALKSLAYSCGKFIDDKGKIIELDKEKLIKLLHVPLDSYTIQGLIKIAPQLKITRNATMNFIEGCDQYNLFNDVIKKVSEEAKVPAIYYDFLAWNNPHLNQHLSCELLKSEIAKICKKHSDNTLISVTAKEILEKLKLIDTEMRKLQDLITNAV